MGLFGSKPKPGPGAASANARAEAARGNQRMATIAALQGKHGVSEHHRKEVARWEKDQRRANKRWP
jgi:hypothetical protein